MSKRRIILLLDGTWNQDETAGNRTNIVRLRDLIADSLDPLNAAPPSNAMQSEVSRAIVSPRTFAGREYVVFYQRGVGTGPFDQVLGGVTGAGLDLNVRRAYRFLSFHYQPGDEIFIFGFSRGAYTARSLTGFLGATGLLRCDACTEAQESLAWSFYRTPPNDRFPGIWKQLEPHVHPRGEFRVTCLGLFETVGALGVPLQGLRRLNRQKFEFHDVELSSQVDLGLHALAIDEHRRPFEASVWRRNNFKRTSAVVEQVWFPGVHADIGGGYFNDQERNTATQRGLDDLALDWMIRRLRANVPDFPVTDEAWIGPPEHGALAPQHDSLAPAYKILGSAIRSIYNKPIPLPLLNKRDVAVGEDPHAKVINESIHIRAIQRLGTQVPIGGRNVLYMPASLVACLPDLIFLYSDTGPRAMAPDTLTVTAADGRAVQPHSEQAAHVFAELRAAKERLQREVPDLLRRLEWDLPDR